MTGPVQQRAGRDAALGLLRRLRRQDALLGIRNSGIAFDVAMLLYEHAVADPPHDVSVDMISDLTGYSGPTIRLVLKRLVEAGSVAPGRRIGKTQLYALTEAGLAGFHRYVEALLDFRIQPILSAAGGPAPPPGPQPGPAPPPARYAGAPPDREVAE
ncbi:hypothetical protein [Falsiroseomonas sp. CW058]|uniref:hypothetical protein n=1 Tax=Falsiroseomonas sp. CW058 TaxID=3388664 RepID=UPI003D31FE0E